MSHDSDSDSIIMSLQDWRQALRTPPSYRIGSSSLRINTKFITLTLAVVTSVLLLLYYSFSTSSQSDNIASKNVQITTEFVEHFKRNYNSTYPLTRPIRTPTGITYRIAVISDLDVESKSKTNEDVWISYLLKGYLSWNPSLSSVTVNWDKKTVKLESSLAQQGRGMELSELVVFNGKLNAFDDRTGVVYEIEDNRIIPWILLADGDGRASKGFKAEWATVKNEKLYVGGLGKEWTNKKGEIKNFDPQWIKEISASGEVKHLNWRQHYIAIRQTAGITFPGYMIHEAVCWSPINKKWFFLPRRSSKQAYRDDTDELMGTNMLITADENFHHISLTRVGDLNPSHGFSSFKFIPGSNDGVIVAIKSEELKGSTATYIMAFTIEGKILMPETKIGDVKYEGIEFI